MKREEDKLQKACVRILRYRYHHLNGCYNHSPNEGKRSEKQGASLKEMGMTSGWPDLEIMGPGGPLFVEFKTPTGRQSGNQKMVEERLTSMGYKYFVIRSLDEFIKLCHEHLGPERDPDREILKSIINK